MEIKRFKAALPLVWSSWRPSADIMQPFSLYYGCNSEELLVDTLANAYPVTILFFWERCEDSTWKGSEEYQYFGAPYRHGCIKRYQEKSPAVPDTTMLLPGGESLVVPCVECNYSTFMMGGGCSLFNLNCERHKPDDKWNYNR